MRFIHTADWHLGRLFFGEHLTEDQAYVLEELLRLVSYTKAEAVIIAGDIYDRAVPPTEAVELLDEVLFKLTQELKVKTMLIAGNHDSASRLDFGSRLLESQGLVVAGRLTAGEHTVVFNDVYGEVVFTLLPYAEPAQVRYVYGNDAVYDEETAMQLRLAVAQQKLEAKRSIAVAHAFIAGGQESESERPLSVGGSFNVGAHNFSGFNYTALGHLHNMQRAGGDNIRYAGSLLKYSFDEVSQKKGVQLVEIDAQGSVSIEPYYLKPRHDVCVVEGWFDDILHDRDRYPKLDDYVCVRLLDERPLIDVHRRLRDIYVNFMCLERPNFSVTGSLNRLEGNYRRMGELELLESFYKAMTGRTLDEAEEKMLRHELNKFAEQERRE